MLSSFTATLVRGWNDLVLICASALQRGPQLVQAGMIRLPNIFEFGRSLHCRGEFASPVRVALDF